MKRGHFVFSLKTFFPSLTRLNRLFNLQAARIVLMLSNEGCAVLKKCTFVGQFTDFVCLLDKTKKTFVIEWGDLTIKCRVRKVDNGKITAN